MKEWKEAGGVIVSSSVEIGRSFVNPAELSVKLKNDREDKVLLMMGSEGFGVSPHLQKHADYIVNI